MKSVAVAALLAGGTLVTGTVAQAGETVEMPDGLQAVEVEETAQTSGDEAAPRGEEAASQEPSDGGEALMQGLEAKLERQAKQEDDGPEQVGEPPAQATQQPAGSEQLEIAPLDEVDPQQAEAATPEQSAQPQDTAPQEQAQPAEDATAERSQAGADAQPEAELGAAPPNADRWKAPQAATDETPPSAAPADGANAQKAAAQEDVAQEDVAQADTVPQDDARQARAASSEAAAESQTQRKLLDVDIPEAKTTTALPSAGQLGADGAQGGSLIPEPDAQAKSCPMEVDDVRVTLRDFDSAIAIQFITVDGDVADLQKRVEALADRYRASDATLAEAAKIDTVRLDRGAQLVVRLDDDTPVQELRARLEKRARKMRFEGRCPQAVTG